MPVSARAVKGLVKLAAFIILVAAVLIVSSGRPDWLMGWVLVGLSVAASAVGVLVMDPELLDERAGLRAGAKAWDIPLVLFTARLGPLATLTVAGLDVRYGWWPELPLPVIVAAVAAFVLGHSVVIWAMAVNKFFSPVVRIQKERGHTVISAGPYQLVRHPGYPGAIVVAPAIPLMLGSLWALVPAALTVAATILRTALEDRTLQHELPGYRGYAQRVRHRLLPGVW